MQGAAELHVRRKCQQFLLFSRNGFIKSDFFFLFPCCLSLSPVHPMWQGPLAVPGGDRQSPIDIAVKKSVFDSELKPLVTTYDPKTCQQIWNNGYSFLVEYDDTTDKNSKLFQDI